MFLNEIYKSLQSRADNQAICTEDGVTSYSQLQKRVNGIRLFIRENIEDNQKGVGLITYSHPDTYATILALWLEGKYYVPLLPTAPTNRNNAVIEDSAVRVVMSPSFYKGELVAPVVRVDEIESSDSLLGFNDESFDMDQLAYVLFTSGSTGRPKGVEISFSNINAFTQSIISLGREIYPTDRCLQMFELTFDMSVDSFVMPFMAGASIYLIPNDAVKSTYVLDLLEEYHLTVLTLVPSVIVYMRTFFKDILEPQVRLCTFAGEGLPADLTVEWQRCIPNARVYNFYGPTECTIYCSYYLLNPNSPLKYNGMLSIGQPMPGCKCDVFSEDGSIVTNGEKGELCLAGPQLTRGYWNNPEKNELSFFTYEGERYYHSGDLCFKDENANIYHCGRIDYQVKIQGFRVELSEIEYYAREAIDNKYSCVCVPYQEQSVLQIGLAIESPVLQTEEIINHIKKSLPPYETPNKIIYMEAFPYNTSGKIDRKQIIKAFESNGPSELLS